MPGSCVNVYQEQRSYFYGLSIFVDWQRFVSVNKRLAGFDNLSNLVSLVLLKWKIFVLCVIFVHLACPITYY